ncbi:23S rRNA (uracil(1939)-C(5))-methyltransferase RlmD [Desulfofundulus thermobenzoicus]|uniref:23S rRNA (Uracil(1939)-C(5))-methyltransferase RlmD n=2 Tax=Desulfofundulus thermobenzoicus TaxID=29376 RepID=A0A6N7IPK6_9FIRM|nr:23S rRNA (uracil(1939)-C(5))-methyltransferase RlmD [Desulfofundulus thermobenzoicus]MQL51168.1 23S rRNA (uracil(1939)-C(5))-methyltransferase RlmD [Desulfofundulus thermobenzoicus]
MNKEFPLKKMEQIELSITGLTHAGEGVGRYRGLAVFVPETAPGDTVLAEVLEWKKNYARARLLAVKKPSPGRRPPRCARFSACGGCRLQHVDYAEQLHLKTGLVKDSLARIGGLSGVAVRDTAGMDNPWHYRNKVVLQVGERGGRYRLGFYAGDSHNLVPIFQDGPGGCLLVDRDLNEVAKVIENLLNKYGHGAPGGINDWKRHKPFFRHVVLRKGFFTGEIMVVLVTGGGQWPGEKAFTGELLSQRSGLTSVVRNINDGPAGVILGRENRLLAGRKCITDRLDHLTFRISPASFYQVNPVQTLVLYRQALDYAALTGRETVVDAYSGVGTIALFLARRAKKVYGLEVVPGAVGDARLNAVLNGIDNAEFHPGAVEERLPALAACGLRPDVVVLDPPRRGCGREALEAVVKMGVPRVVYVSCDPGTLARDLGYLAGKGYRVEEVQPVDMFPWTQHVECVVYLAWGLPVSR